MLIDNAKAGWWIVDRRIRFSTFNVAAWIGLLTGVQLGLAMGPVSASGQVPLEHWTHRGGPYHWLGVRPVAARIEIQGRGVVACGRDSVAPCASMPVFLMGCRARSQKAAAIPLQGSLHFDALPDDPHALQYADPGNWRWLWKRRPYFERGVAVALTRVGLPDVRFSATVTRERWAYSTDTSYEVAPLPIREIAEAMATAGDVELEIDGDGITVRAVFDLAGRTGQFLAACDSRSD